MRRARGCDVHLRGDGRSPPASGSSGASSWRTRQRAAAAPIGASFTFLALATGSIWGKPMWGPGGCGTRASRRSSSCCSCTSATWRCGPRSTTRSVRTRERRARHRGRDQRADHSLLGGVVVHVAPAASVTKLDRPSIAIAMLIPLFIMIAGFQLYFGWAICRRLRGEILRRERNATWLKEIN